MLGAFSASVVLALFASAFSSANGWTTTSGWGHAPRHNYTLEVREPPLLRSLLSWLTRCQTVTGFFLQDLNSTDASTFDFVSNRQPSLPMARYLAS
jgi:hypothetical protein